MAYRLTDPAFLANPAPILAQMRAEGPLARVQVPLVGQVWMTTSDAAARALLKDTDRFRRDPEPITGKNLARRFWWMPRYMAPLTRNLVVQDDPEHKRLRRLVERAFARTTIEDLRPEITALADDLLDQLPNSGSVDIVSTYTRRLPFLVICAHLGIPPARRARLAARIAPLSHVTSPLRAAYALLRLKGAMAEMRAEFAAARAAPGPGLISALIAGDGADHLSEDELLAMVMTLFIAGHETTVHLINSAILAMIQTPDLKQRLRDAPEARHLMIEEFMRFFSPVMITKAHFAVADADILGHPVKRGEMVTAGLLAANHDPTRVDTPEELRPDRRPNAHLGFGFGPHVCLGMQLARLEAEIALERLIARHPYFDLAGPPPPYLKRPGLRAPAYLRLRLG